MSSFLVRDNIWTSLNRNLFLDTDRTEADDSLCVQCQDICKSELLERLNYLRDIFIELDDDSCKMFIILNSSLTSLNDLIQQREKIVIRHLKNIADVFRAECNDYSLKKLVAIAQTRMMKKEPTLTK